MPLEMQNLTDRYPYKIVVWGMGEDYDFTFNQIQFEILKKNIVCVALVCRDADVYTSIKDGFPVVKKSEFHSLDYDYLVISSSRYFDEIKEDVLGMGVRPNQIIDGRMFRQPQFDFARYASLIQNPVTILSDDCWGGYAYNRLRLPFTSPLINIYWDRDQYAKFIMNPLFYLDTELQMVREGDLFNGIHPIGKLGTAEDYVELKLIHCYSFSNALEQWNRRIKRINRNNIFVKMGFSNATNPKQKKEWIEAFGKVKHKKVLFYNGQEEMPEIFKEANGRFIWTQMTADRVDDFDYNDYLRGNYFWDLDLLKMLTEGTNYSRYSSF